ncbi:MAG: DUF3298 domain-containing protein [Anaerolineales bacterium]|nr:DUF3298 domain-containing protein [Anaerolineales bacterium]
MKTIKSKLSLFATILATLACGSLTPTQTAPALPSITVPLANASQLKASPFSEESPAPVYTITAQVPYIEGVNDPRVQEFNSALKAIVESEVEAFKGGMAEMPTEPLVAGSSFNLAYELVSQKENIWSIKFNGEGYTDGAAHPYHYSITINYDLTNGRQLELAELFNADPLPTIAEYCKAELSKRNIGFDDGFQQGVEPIPDNYRNWNLSAEGLVITFDEYQVAPYAAGPQVVTIPFSALQGQINPESALKPYLQ